MKTVLVTLLCCLSVAMHAQDYATMAKELQTRYKDDEAALIQSSTTYDFARGTKAPVKATVSTQEKILSLRYNASISRAEWYDQNSQVEKFFGVSSLRQRAAEDTKICGSLTREGLFYDDSKLCVQKLRLKEIGETWDITLMKRVDDAKYLTSIFFQDELPSMGKKITFTVPLEVEIELREFNLAEFNIKKTERAVSGKKVIEYVAGDLPGFKTEDMNRGNQYTQPHVLVLIKSIVKDGQKVTVLSSPQDLYAWYSGLTRQLNPRPEVYKSMVTQLTQGKKTDEEKIKAIYYWVQDNIRYIAFEDGIAAFKPSEAQDVFEKRFGDCKGMANLTKEMLKVAGYDARLTWIGTRRIMYDQSLPSLAVNNHMICTVFLNNKKYYLDATEKYVPFGENATRIQGRPVMIEDGDKYIDDKIIESDKTTDLDSRALSVRIDGNNLEGQIRIDLKGEAKKNFLYGYHYTKSDVLDKFVKDFISTSNKDITTKDVKLPDMEERSGQLSMTGAITYAGAVSSFNNEYYIDIDPAKSFKNWTIRNTRQSDVDFGEKIHRKISVELTVPDGYSVSHLPEKIDVMDPEFSFSMHYTQTGDKIVYTKELNIPDGIIKKKSFERWNAAVKKLAQGYQNQIVLKK